MGQKVDNLIKDNIVKEDPNNPNAILFDVSFSISKEAVEAGAFELFASYFGWAPTIVKSTPEKPIVLDEDGKAVMIPNPMTAQEAGSVGLRSYATGILRDLFLKQGEQAGRQKAQQDFDALNV